MCFSVASASAENRPLQKGHRERCWASAVPDREQPEVYRGAADEMPPPARTRESSGPIHAKGPEYFSSNDQASLPNVSFHCL
jgi:hypothetical protein